jgi:hypothetical protein
VEKRKDETSINKSRFEFEEKVHSVSISFFILIFGDGIEDK